MSNVKHETIADIVAEMRKDIAEGTVGIWSDFGGEIARRYADRIEAAAKREREAGAEAAQVCGEVGEMIGREAAGKDSLQVGNAAKMREALSDACYAMFNFLKTQNGGYEEMAEALDKAKAALSAPPRNCERFSNLNAAQRYYIEHGCPKGLGMIVDGEIRKTPWKSQFEKWLFNKVEGGKDADE